MIKHSTECALIITMYLRWQSRMGDEFSSDMKLKSTRVRESKSSQPGRERVIARDKKWNGKYKCEIICPYRQ